MNKDSRSILFKIIDEALELDSVGSSKEAYCKYLDGIKVLCSHLIDQQTYYGGIPHAINAKRRTKQILSVVRKCLERLDALVDENGSETTVPPKKESGGLAKCREVLSPEISPADFLLEPDRQKRGLERMHSHLPMIIVPSIKSRHHMSAMEQAQRENALLSYAYEKRIALPTDRCKRISLQLELQRRMTENLAIAKAKDAACRQEEMKREKKALEIAAKRLSTNDKSEKIRDDYNNNSKELEKQWLYAQMLQYEDHEPWVGNLRKRLKDEPEMTTKAIQDTLSTTDYPLVQWMLHSISNVQNKIQLVLDMHSESLRLVPGLGKQLQTIEVKSRSVCVSPAVLPSSDDTLLSMFDPLNSRTAEDDAVRKVSNVDLLHLELFEDKLRHHLDDIVTDISHLMDTLVQLISLSYEITDDFQSICYQTVEVQVYSFLWWKLQMIFRLCNLETERRISQSIAQMQHQSPDEMGVPCLFSELPTCIYQEIVNRLQLVTQMYTPISKLQSLVAIVEKISDHSQMNADDLISIMSYLIVQSDLPQLTSECDALDCLVPHVFLMGEEGFVLTTFQTALKYLETQMDSVYPENK